MDPVSNEYVQGRIRRYIVRMGKIPHIAIQGKPVGNYHKCFLKTKKAGLSADPGANN